MKGFLTTHKGMEDIAALEVNELIGSKASVAEGCTKFPIKKYDDLFTLCYLSQSAKGVYYLLSEFDFKDIFNDFKKNIQKIDFKEWLNKSISFRVKCIKDFDESISTPEIEKELGAIIIGEIKNKSDYSQKVDLMNPGIVIFVYVTGKKGYICIDFAGFDLSKRNYNIFTHPGSVKGTVAYSLVRLSGYSDDEILLDCFSGSGTIPIEAAFFASKFPVNFYNKEKFAFLKIEAFKSFDFKKFFRKIDGKIADKKLDIYDVDSSMKYITYAKKNSKIAGMAKKITFSRMDLEWLDTKFGKGEVNKIAAKIPSGAEDIEKLYNEFFYQAEFILESRGKIAVIGKKDLVEKYSSKHKFRIEEERAIYSGKERYDVFVLSKTK
ncbi:hypothetical protein HYU09_02370 [Candidatus Woesearchaeota archaeon]|nr:hypothetical protein [Candidatus Woesearchaeota archaeon]